MFVSLVDGGERRGEGERKGREGRRKEEREKREGERERRREGREGISQLSDNTQTRKEAHMPEEHFHYTPHMLAP